MQTAASNRHSVTGHLALSFAKAAHHHVISLGTGDTESNVKIQFRNSCHLTTLTVGKII
jgi:hypothetical protein